MGEEGKGIPLKKTGICLRCGRLTLIYLGTCLCGPCTMDGESAGAQPARIAKYRRMEV